MKTIKLILLATIVLASCSKEKTSDDDPVIPKAGANFNFYKSADLYSEAQDLRSEGYSDAFEITEVEREGNNLDITVEFKGNCKTNKFDVIWDGIIMQSWPMQTKLIVKRTSSDCDSNGETKKEIISIDLVEFIGDKVLVDGTVFHVSNASKTPDEANADKTVSNN